AHFRAALALDPRDAYLRAAYADFLLDNDRARDALPLLRDDTRNDSLLLRLALAERALPDVRTAFDAHRADLAARFDAARARGARAFALVRARMRAQAERRVPDARARRRRALRAIRFRPARPRQRADARRERRRRHHLGRSARETCCDRCIRRGARDRRLRG